MEGQFVGLIEGSEVEGCILGTSDGIADGVDVVGPIEGFTLGDSEGLSEGLMVGGYVGDDVVGAKDGKLVVGLEVKTVVGFAKTAPVRCACSVGLDVYMPPAAGESVGVTDTEGISMTPTRNSSTIGNSALVCS